MTAKYSVPDDHWEEDDEDTKDPDRTMVNDHDIDVMYNTEPQPADNYDRSLYTVSIKYDDETGEPYVLFVVKHRWKGNYWRDTTDLDWRDVPEPVREQVAAVLPVDRPEDLDSGTRLIGMGGESRFEKYHKPRLDNYGSGDEIWADDYLQGAVNQLDGVAETLDDHHPAQERVEELVSEAQDLASDIKTGGETDA